MLTILLRDWHILDQIGVPGYLGVPPGHLPNWGWKKYTPKLRKIEAWSLHRSKFRKMVSGVGFSGTPAPPPKSEGGPPGSGDGVP